MAEEYNADGSEIVKIKIGDDGSLIDNDGGTGESEEEKAAREAEEARIAAEEENKGQEEDVIELNDDQVKTFFEKRFGKKVEDLEELTREKVVEPELDEDVAAFQKFKKETGRGFGDFIKLQEDFDSVDPDQRLRQYYKDKFPDFTDEEINAEIEDKFGYDPELDDEETISRIERKKKLELSEAKNWFESTKEGYKIPLESRGLDVPEEVKNEFEEFKRSKENSSKDAEEILKRAEYFDKETSKVFENFEGFEFQTEDGTKYSYKPAEKERLIDEQSDVNNFLKKFVNEDNYIQDAAKFHKAIAVASDVDKFFEFAFSLGKEKALKEFEAQAKNISGEKRTPESVGKDGVVIRHVDERDGKTFTIKK